MPPAIYLAKSGATNPPVIPADAVTRTFGIFGMKGSGKTTTGRVLAEGICKLGGNVAVLDQVGVWWGITRDGEGPGVPGVVLGGEHADIPLEETAGQLVAEFVVSRQHPVVVIDLKLMRKGAAKRFMADFLEGVYDLNRRPLHLIFEEADRALPQNPRGMDPTLGRVLGAAEDIVKLGRSRGLGSTLVLDAERRRARPRGGAAARAGRPRRAARRDGRVGQARRVERPEEAARADR